MPVSNDQERHRYANIVAKHLLQGGIAQVDGSGFTFDHHPRYMQWIIYQNVKAFDQFAQSDFLFQGNKGGGVTQRLNQVLNKILPYPFYIIQDQPLFSNRVENELD